MSRHERCNLFIENFPFEELAKPCAVCETAGAHDVLGGSHPHSTGTFNNERVSYSPDVPFCDTSTIHQLIRPFILLQTLHCQSHLHVGLPFGTGAGNNWIVPCRMCI